MLITLGLVVTSEALAQQPAKALAINFEKLGIREPLVLSGSNASREVYLPINPGLKPEALELKVQAPPLLPEGYLTLESRGRTLAEIPLKAGEGTYSISLPTQGLTLKDGLFHLKFRLNLKVDDLCESVDLYKVSIQPQSKVYLTGNAKLPSDLAHFFPPFLRKVVFYVPEPVPEEAQEAVLWAAGFVARKYRGLDVRIRVKPLLSIDGALSDPHTADPFTRVILWNKGVGAELVKRQVPGHPNVAPALVLGSSLEASKLFLSELGMKTAIFPAENTAVFEMKSPEDTAERITLRDLGYPPLRATGMGLINLDYAFSLADLGPDVFPTGIHLQLVHTPPVEGENVYLEINLNGAAVHTTKLGLGQSEFWAPLPKRYLQRNNHLSLKFFYSPPGGTCSLGALPFVVTANPDGSFLTLEKGLAVAGFDALPQAFLPSYWVYLEKRDTYHLSLAATLTYAMQKTTSRTLRPRIANQPDRFPLLAVGGEKLAEQLKAPLRGPGVTITDLSGKVWLKVDAKSPYASLQAFKKGGDYVLLLSHVNGGLDLMEPLVLKLLQPEGWYALHGDTALMEPEASPVVFRLSDSALRTQGSWQKGLSWLRRYRFFLALAMLLAVTLFLFWIYPRVVRPES